MGLFSSKQFRLTLVGLVMFQIFFYSFLFFFHGIFHFQKVNYLLGAHHYIQDPRIQGGKFALLTALGQYDGQWYLKVADKGYPLHPKIATLSNKHVMDGLTYAYFPLYPMVLVIENYFLHNIELAAFFIVQITMVVDIMSLYWILIKLFSETIAVKTTFLLFLFPFSIFYRSYFTEGLYLFLLIWFTYFLIKKKWILSGVCLGLLNVTKANGYLLNGLLLWYLFVAFRLHTVSWRKTLMTICIVCLPMFLWSWFTYVQTGNPFYFYAIRSAWVTQTVPFLFSNIATIFLFPFLPFHYFNLSQIEIISMLIIPCILWETRKKMLSTVWWVGLLLWVSPLLVTNLMSFSRYQSVSFPVFLGVALLLNKWNYAFVLVISLIGLLITGLFFVNWYWIG